VILEFSDLSFIPPFISGLILIIMHKNIATALVGIFILLFISIGFIYLLRTRVKIAKLKHELEVEIKDIHRKLSENLNRLYE
jgi:archaellum biogenesis protein FlaJ (TadC family)